MGMQVACPSEGAVPTWVRPRGRSLSNGAWGSVEAGPTAPTPPPGVWAALHCQPGPAHPTLCPLALLPGVCVSERGREAAQDAQEGKLLQSDF